jgi:hypothetical protein
MNKGYIQHLRDTMTAHMALLKYATASSEELTLFNSYWDKKSNDLYELHLKWDSTTPNKRDVLAREFARLDKEGRNPEYDALMRNIVYNVGRNGFNPRARVGREEKLMFGPPLATHFSG